MPGYTAASLPLVVDASMLTLLLTAQHQPRLYFTLNKGLHGDTQDRVIEYLEQILLARASDLVYSCPSYLQPWLWEWETAGQLARNIFLIASVLLDLWLSCSIHP